MEEKIKTLGREFLTYPEDLDINDFYSTNPREIFIAISYCIKDLYCPAGRFSGDCNPNCQRCSISAILRVCSRLGITARIFTDGTGVKEHLDENARKYRWIVGLSCPYEINTLCEPFRKRYGNKQLLFPIWGNHCRSEEDRARRRGSDSRIQLDFNPRALLEMLGRLPG